MGTNPQRVTSHADSQEQLKREQLYYDHRQELAALGHDPDMIGCTEVKQPCCRGCGASIPWEVIQRYR